MEQKPTNSSDSLHEEHSVAAPKESFFGEMFRFALIALLIVLPIRLFIAQPFIVSGASMEDTFSTGNYLIVDQLSYRFIEPERGDVLIFKYPEDPSKHFIKRLIGLPGETVQIHRDSVAVIDPAGGGTALQEPYIGGMHQSAPLEYTLGENEYFVMGDNRDESSDSRIWGPISREEIVGRAFVRLLPVTQIDLLPGAYEFETE